MTITPGTTAGTTSVTVKENRGNKTVKVDIIVEEISPQIQLNTESYTGPTYESGSETYSNIYHTITFNESENVTKYQYSTDSGTTWNDMPEVNHSKNYTSTFPLSSNNKPNWLGDVTGGSTGYQFENDGSSISSGTWSGNKQIANSTCHSYIPIDLRSTSSSDTLTVEVNYTISSEANYDYGYIAISETSDLPASGNIVDKASGNNGETKASTSVTGAKIFYLHFWYVKDQATDSFEDCLKINSLTLSSDTFTLGNFEVMSEYTKTGNTAKYKIATPVDKVYQIRAVFSNGSTSNASKAFRVNIKEVVLGLNADIAGVRKGLEKEVAKIIGEGYGTLSVTSSDISKATARINGNSLLVTGVDSGQAIITVKESNQEKTASITVVTQGNNYSIATVYYGSLSEAVQSTTAGQTIKVERNVPSEEDYEEVTIDKDITLDLQTYTLTRIEPITVNTECTLNLKGTGKITASRCYQTILNNGTLNIQEALTIENPSARAVEQYGLLNMTDGTISGQIRDLHL